jgi:hypothetical protein
MAAFQVTAEDVIASCSKNELPAPKFRRKYEVNPLLFTLAEH